MVKTKQSPTRESDRIESELRRLILNLELEPGLAVSEATLMKQYNWGRTPLREACQRLAEQALLQMVPRQGVVIMPLNVFDFVEVMDAMSMVIGTAAALAAWDLHDFARRLQDVENASNAHALERPHLTRLGIVSGLGLLFGALALNIRIDLGFGVVFALGLVAVVGLSRLVRET